MIKIDIPKDDIWIPIEKFYYIPPDVGGIYRIYDKSDKLLYIGKSKKIQYRIRQHLRGLNSGTEDVKHHFFIVKCFYVECPMEIDIYETYLINTLKPPLNIDKVYTYESSRNDPEYLNYKPSREEKLQEKLAWQRLCEKIRNRAPVDPA